MMMLSHRTRVENRKHQTPFAKDENGSITIFALFMVMIMMMVAGIGVDMMRHEMERTRLQGVSDRAALAAADIDQTLDPEAVVRDYFAKSGMADLVSDVDVQSSAGQRSVTVEADLNFPTMFMDHLGRDSLDVFAISAAQESVPLTEISLVLDISGSMRHSNRIQALRPAAANFLDVVMTDDAVSRTSVTLIPYAGQTNVGPVMFDLLGGVRIDPSALDETLGGIPADESHGGWNGVAGEGGKGGMDDVDYVHPNVSSCIDMNSGDFATSQLPFSGLDQVPHFMNWPGDDTIDSDTGNPMISWGWCPTDETAVQYFSNDREDLKSFINNMPLHDGTGTHIAMKYAVAMLDPSSRNDVSNLIANGVVPSTFSGRPAAFDDLETQKYIILMTDGQITEQTRPTDNYDAENLTTPLKARPSSDSYAVSTASSNINAFQDQCTIAKGQLPRPITVYTIAFEAPAAVEDQMRDCASSPAHYFSANDGNIGDIFEAIGRSIGQLKLTQ